MCLPMYPIVSSRHWPSGGDKMFQSVIGFLGAPFIELILFVLLAAYSVIHRNDRRGISCSRYSSCDYFHLFRPGCYCLAITDPSSMLTLSVFGMFVVTSTFLHPDPAASMAVSRGPWPIWSGNRKNTRFSVTSGVQARQVLLFAYFFQSFGQRRQPFHFSVISPTIGCGTISRMPYANWE